MTPEARLQILSTQLMIYQLEERIIRGELHLFGLKREAETFLNDILQAIVGTEENGENIHENALPI